MWSVWVVRRSGCESQKAAAGWWWGKVFWDKGPMLMSSTLSNFGLRNNFTLSCSNNARMMFVQWL
jgi:hypothetical protein